VHDAVAEMHSSAHAHQASAVGQIGTHDCVVWFHSFPDGHVQLFDDAGQHIPLLTVSPAAQQVPAIPVRPLGQHTPFEQLFAPLQEQATFTPQPTLTSPQAE
jgi:hypothetical protein